MTEFLYNLLAESTIHDALIHVERYWWYVAIAAAAAGIPAFIFMLIVMMGKDSAEHVKSGWRNTVEPSLLVALPVAAGMALLSSGIIGNATNQALQQVVAEDVQENMYLGSARIADIDAEHGLNVTIELYPDTDVSETFTLVLDAEHDLMVPEDAETAESLPIAEGSELSKLMKSGEVSYDS